MFYLYAFVAILASTVAITTGAYLVLDAYRRGRLLLMAPIALGLAALALLPAGWIGELVPPGTTYWGGANPLAVLAAWPVTTAIFYGALWMIAPPQVRKNQ